MVKEIEKIMRTRNIYILSACLAAVLSCTEFQEENIEVNEAEKVAMTFTASICDETDPETKTVLDGQLGDELRKVLWSPGDEIGIAASNSSVVERFENTESENSETATFKGGVSIADTYYAGYPYSGVTYADVAGYKALIFDLPQTQKYVAGTFGKDCAPMVAKAAYGEDLQFRNLCGLLALNLTGEESVKSITFTGKDANGEAMYVSGHFVVAMTYEDVPAMEPGANFTAFSWPTNRSATLECDEPVQLSTTEATPFYFVLPPATYETFTLLITTADGKIMMKEGTKPLTIKRSDVQPTADLAYVETVSINLSKNGIANSYIVPEAGIYSFQANVIGNGYSGIIDGAGFHTSDAAISPASAELLWCEHEGAVSGVSFDESNGRITFLATGQEGNAVIAAKDADGNIIWSWHIWMTDQPAEHLYKNSTGEYIVLDRNLGATRAEQSSDDSEWQETKGLAYQWGRKDPFVRYKEDNLYEGTQPTVRYSTSYDQVPIATTIANPTVFYGLEHSYWTDSSNQSLWSVGKKTIYDPCPPGYRVPDRNIWKGFTQNGNSVYGEFEQYVIQSVDRKGWNFIYDGYNATYYPATWCININGNVEEQHYVTLWSSESCNSSRSYTFRSYYYTEGDSHVVPLDHNEDITRGNMVRCMKDETDHINYISVTDIRITDENTAQATANILSYTGEETIQTGFVLGNSEDVTIESGTVYATGKRTGTVSAQINGLDESLTYYIRAYLTTADETIYSQAVVFSTYNSEGAINLSAEGTANCYIVSHQGLYTFNASIIGNGSSGIVENAGFHTENTAIYPSSAELIWCDTNNAIYDISFDSDSNEITFKANKVEGNAVIGAKDANGNIIWSWHIWMTDEPVEQIYKNDTGTYGVLDRNLGATRADRGIDNEWMESRGLLYFWGRKDPFHVSYFSDMEFYMSIEQTIAAPNVRHNYGSSDYLTSWWGYGEEKSRLWNEDSKTIYDPCPTGYRVAISDIWRGFTSTGSDSSTSSEFLVKNETWDYGWNFYIDDEKVETAWYPATHFMYWSSWWDNSVNEGRIWAADYDTSVAFEKCFTYNTVNIFIDGETRERANGYPVRCMKITRYADIEETPDIIPFTR